MSTLQEAFPINDVGDLYDVHDHTFRWGGRSTKAYRRALYRLNWSGRLTERIDAWLAEQKQMAPNMSPLLWSALAFIMTRVLSNLLTYLLASR